MTLAALTLDVEDMLYGSAQVKRPSENTLTTAVASTGDVSMQFDNANLARRGNYYEHITNDGVVSEIIQLVDDQDGQSDIPVRRAQLRTSALAEMSVGDVFRVNPEFPIVKIQRAITETINNDLAPTIWYRTTRSVTPNDDRFVYELNASDYVVERMWQSDIASTAVGDATFDFTGGASEDLWTSASHGLAVGDIVRFTAAGTGADEYAVDTLYWVATVPDANTFQLSATESTTVLEGSADSVGTWTIQLTVKSFDPFPRGFWDVETNVNTSKDSSTGRALRIYHWYHDDFDIYYTARTRPSSAAITSLPTELMDMVPWGACARLLGMNAVSGRQDTVRSRSIGASVSPSQPYADARYFRSEFMEMRKQYKRMLRRELPPLRDHTGLRSLIRK